MTKYHVVLTDDTVDGDVLLATLKRAGIEVHVKPIELQQAAQMVAEIIWDYPVGEQGNARDKLIAWMDETLDALDDSRLQRINDSIEKLKRDHGKLVTWHCKGGYIVLDIPLEYAHAVSHTVNDEYRWIRIRELTNLLLPQLERIAPSILRGVLDTEYFGDQNDYSRLVALACRDIFWRET